ncbi:MAG: 50S ribosomal protein L31e [Nanoarchaeota archaeon]
MVKEKKKKDVLERTYNVPLRKEYRKAPNWNRTPRAVKALREFIIKHMKGTDVKIGKYANDLLWKDGIKKPPHHIKVNAVKDNEGLVKVELFGAPVEVKVEKKETAGKKEEKTGSVPIDIKATVKKDVVEEPAKDSIVPKSDAKIEEILDEKKKSVADAKNPPNHKARRDIKTKIQKNNSGKK